MSDKKQDAPVTAAPADATPADSTESKRPNIAVRAWNRLRNNPKTAIAVVGGVALVSAGAFVGRKTAPYHVELVEDDVELEPLVLVASDDFDDSQSA